MGLSGIEDGALAFFLFALPFGILAAASILGAAWYGRKRPSSRWPRVLIASPAILYGAGTLLFFQDRSPNLYTWATGAISIVIWIVLIHLLLRGNSDRRKALLALLSICLGLMLTNPGIINFWSYVDVDNDPFAGRGVAIARVEEWHALVSDEDGGQYRADEVLVLADGRRLPGVFAYLEKLPTGRWPNVLVEHVPLSNYPYRVIAYERVERVLYEPLVNLPWFQREYKTNRPYEAGWAFTMKESTEDSASVAR